MKEISMEAFLREEKGTVVSRRLRKQGLIPAVIYGKKENILIGVEERKLEGILHSAYGENVIVNLHLKKDEKKEMNKKVFIKEIQHNPLTDKILHVDFYQFTLDKEITAKVPVAVKGEAPGVSQQGGVLGQVLWEIEIECLPTDIPEKFEIDVSNLKIGDSIQIKDLFLPPKVKVLAELEQIVVSVVPPKKIEVEEVKPAEEIVAGPELIRKEKKPEEEEGVKEAKKEEKKE